MRFSNPNPKINSWVLLLVSLSISLLLSPSLSDPRIAVASVMCGHSNVTAEALFPNFGSVMEHLSEKIMKQQWGFYSVSDPNAPVFGFAQCHKDLSEVDCQLCFAEARTKIPHCLPASRGRIYLEGCFIRYDNYEFYDESVNAMYDSNLCSGSNKRLKGREEGEDFGKRVEAAVMSVTEEALGSRMGGFGAAEERSGAPGAYALGQCWNTVNSTGCGVCLEDAWREVRKCLPAAEGRALNAGCYLRYSTRNFFSEVELTMDGDWLGYSQIVGASIVGCASLVLALLGAYIGYSRFSKRRDGLEKISRVPSVVKKSELNYKYEELEQATDFFNSSNKLGQGGSSSVFKGTLSDGRTVAVKRLCFSTRQWVDDVFNEVNLISGIEHKNLVRLLGCSIEGPESLLVYEFLANKSLDQVLFDKKKTQILNWKQRFNIIMGIAEGLAYLHGGSQRKIIHRDIKISNILLDENLSPKIADFGLARCAAADKSHISTGIAGTMGYMAPEYIIRGQLTEKADVYAFGVLSLEIACGRRNNTFCHDSGSVLQNVWKHYKAGSITRVLECDSLKGDGFQEREASNALQIGLLCTQTSAALRPSMSEVVRMLTAKESETRIPSPKQPPFLNASVLAPTDSTKLSSFSTVNTTTSNWHTAIDVSELTSPSSIASDDAIVIQTCEPR
ncbi:cysteine-rich receptor-like protein kinase 42 [Rhododendron vialii]|uniref:cysteine-rich receptor-like protein kinase 42 n=1 Tax=Rhododendron vialii TaxID=182163 RepID=UPI00265FD84D|nr:cysteine-rich receptor-like protein kinase 42 [Rhododendron vialii]